MRHLVRAVAISVAGLVVSCQTVPSRQAEPAAASAPTATTVQTCAQQQQHSSLTDQKMCAEQAKKFFDETAALDNSKHPLKNEFISHYDATTRVCYVRIDYTTRTPGKDTGEVAVSSSVFDAFEGRNLASYTWFSEKGKKFWQVKPFECWTKAIGEQKVDCSSSAGFEDAVEKLFGLGE